MTYVRQTLTGQLGVSLRTAREVTSTIRSRIGPTLLLVGLGTVLSTVIGIWIGVKGGWRRGSRFDTSTLYGSMALYSIPEGWLGMLLLLVFSGMLGLFPAGGFETGGQTGVARFVDVLNHLFLPVANPHPRLRRAVRDHHALVDDRRDPRGLRHEREGQGRARAPGAPAATSCPTRSCPPSR